MAYSVTNRGVVTVNASASATDTETCTSFTAQPGDLLAVITGGSFGSAASFTISDTFAGTGAWTQTNTTVGNVLMSIFTAIAGSSPGAGTITITRTAGVMNTYWSSTYLQISGQTTSATYLGATGSNSTVASDTSLSLTLSSTPNPNSLVIGGAICDAGTSAITQPSGWLELHDISHGVGSVQFESAYVRRISDTNLIWSTFTAGAFAKIIVAVEILTTSVYKPINRGLRPYPFSPGLAR